MNENNDAYRSKLSLLSFIPAFLFLAEIVHDISDRFFDVVNSFSWVDVALPI
jgi:hypothetical protein